MKRTFREVIEIDAPPEAVWAVLTDFDAYPDWNPFVGWLRGDVREGGRIRVLILPWSDGGTALSARITQLRAPEALVWRGGVTGLFTGEHIFRIEPVEHGRSRFIHEEVFVGVLMPFFERRIRRLAPMYERFNVALAARVQG